MASADYRLCDVCHGKAFYDSNLSYEMAERKDGAFVYPGNPFRIAGEPQPYGMALGYLGDWAVLCTECAKTHKTAIVKVEQIPKEPPNA